MNKTNYGKYPIPAILERIISLQNELKQKGMLPYRDLLGYYFSIDGVETRYLNTPLDVISFAWPGTDGIHYGFLTDFGAVKKLEEAYIVRVSPMDFDEPVKIVARNIHDFMRMLIYTPDALDLLDINTSKEEYTRFIESRPDLAATQTERNDAVRTIFQETFELQPIDNAYAYLQDVKNERDKQIVLPTQDGIGVVNEQLSTGNDQPMKVTRDTFLQIDAVRDFFQKASYGAKLAFLRDCQSMGLLYDNEEIKKFLKAELIKMGLPDEALRLSYPESDNENETGWQQIQVGTIQWTIE